MKFIISTLGCKINQADSREMARLLVGEGLSPWSSGSGREKSPDLVVVNTCAVTQKAVAKSWRQFEALKKKYRKSFFVLAGCFPAVYFSKAKKISADFIWKGPISKKAGREIVEHFFSSRKINRPNKKKENKKKDVLIAFQDRSRYFLKIQDGCGQFCSYCIIPYTRGKPKSRKEKEIIQELGWLAKMVLGKLLFLAFIWGFWERKRGPGNKRKNSRQFFGQTSGEALPNQ